MHLADIRLMYEYNTWANRLLLACAARVTRDQFFAPTTHSFPSLHQTLAHILGSEHGWRVIFETGEVNFDAITPYDVTSVEALAKRWDAERAAWDAYLGTLTDADMTRIISYPVDDGSIRRRVLWHCLYHVVNHGMQHRSEAAHMLTEYGQSPGDIDFTLFLREAGY